MAKNLEQKIEEIDSNLLKVAEVVHKACHSIAELEAENKQLDKRIDQLEGEVRYLENQIASLEN